jgi:GTP-binding protein
MKPARVNPQRRANPQGNKPQRVVVAGTHMRAAPSPYPGACLLLSAARPPQFPPDDGVEVAIAGRSNAGKSSAINAITGRRALARTSKLPGRTRLLNFFQLNARQRLVDLPGYGYAAAPETERAAWATLIEALIPRRSLAGLFLVVDARRGLLAGDEQLLGWATAHAQPVHVLLSKCDLLKRAEARALLLRSQAALSGRATAQLFSSRDGTGVDSAREKLATWLEAKPSEKKEPRQS